MAKQTISIGTVANDHTGDPLRTAFTKVNANFTELYTAVSTIPTDINQLSDADSLLGQGGGTPASIGDFTFTGTSININDVKFQNGTSGLLFDYWGYPSNALRLSNVNHGESLLIQTTDDVVNNTYGRTSLRWHARAVQDNINYPTSRYSQVDVQNDGVWIKNAEWTEGGYYKYWHFDNSGDLTLPVDGDIKNSNGDSVLGSSFNIGSVDLHNGGVQTGQILQFTDNTHQSIITGPAPSGVDVSAQRVIIQGQRATGQGEGGDVYLWGGDSDVNGGDIKIYAGDADSNSAGQGGYIHLTSGTGYVQGGNLTLQGGSSTTTGGDLYLSSGYGGVNHGQVFLNSGGSQWTFGKTGDLSLPTNGGIVFDRNNTSIKVGMGFHISSGEGVSIEAIDQTDPNNLIYKGWYFGSDGKLTAPNGLSLINNTIEGVAQNQIGTQWAYATNYLGGSDNQGSQGVNLAVNAETLALLTTWESNNVVPWTMQFSGEEPVEVVSMFNYGDRIQVSTSVATFRSLPVVITSGDYQDSTPATVVLKAATKSLVFGDDGKLTLPTNGTINYAPTTPADWAGTAPTTIQEALDRLAASIKLLNSTGA